MGRTNFILEDFVKVDENDELEGLRCILNSPPNSESSRVFYEQLTDFSIALYVTPTKTLSNFLSYAVNNTDNIYFMDSLIQILSEPLPAFEPTLLPTLLTKLDFQESFRLVLFGPNQLEILRLKECLARALLVGHLLTLSRRLTNYFPSARASSPS